MIIREKITHKEIEEFYESETKIDFGELSFGDMNIHNIHNEEKIYNLFFEIVLAKTGDIRRNFKISNIALVSIKDVWLNIQTQSYMFQSNVKYDVIFEVEIENQNLLLKGDTRSKKYQLQLF